MVNADMVPHICVLGHADILRALDPRSRDHVLGKRRDHHSAHHPAGQAGPAHGPALGAACQQPLQPGCFDPRHLGHPAGCSGSACTAELARAQPGAVAAARFDRGVGGRCLCGVRGGGDGWPAQAVHPAHGLAPQRPPPATARRAISSRHHRSSTYVTLHYDVSTQVRLGDWKLIYYHGYEQPYQLFNLKDDPNELDDRASRPDCRRTLERLSGRLMQGWDPAAITARFQRHLVSRLHCLLMPSLAPPYKLPMDAQGGGDA